MESKERASLEAQRLLNEPLLMDAFEEVMTDAFAEFQAIDIDPTTIHAVIALQQRIVGIQLIRDQLNSNITAAGHLNGGIAFENKQT